MTKTYTPQPGTIPFRVIQYLRRLQPGASVANGPIADELDINVNSITACMQPALHHGVVKRERRDGLIYWSLGDGTPAQAAPDAEDDPEMASKIVLTPAAVAKAASTNNALAKRLERAIKVGPDTSQQPVQIELDLPPPEPVFGAFSDGSLSIKHGDSFVSLGEKHARALQEFMNRSWAPT